MTSLRDLSDAELEAIANDDHEGFTAAAATRLGIRPELALAVRSQESRGNPNAVSPKGARGAMQLMPGTAKELGVDIDDPYQNIEGGVRYLRQQHDTFGDEDLALAAYNAGPGVVRKYGGIPPYKETQGYVEGVRSRDISQASDEELTRIAGGADAPPEVTVEVDGRPDLGVGVAHADNRPKPSTRLPAVPQRLPQRQGPTIAQDAISGALQPFKDLGHTVMEGYRSTEGGKPLDPMFIPKLAGSVAGLAGAPFMAGVRPSARGINNTGLQPHAFNWGAWNGSSPFRKLEGEEAQAHVEGALNTALSAASPKRVGAPKAKPMTFEEVSKADADAWNKVDASGYRFPPQEVQTVAADVRRLVDDAGPELYPEADKVARRIEQLASRGQLTPSQANRLRGQVGEKLLGPGSDEVSVGRDIKARIDAMIDGANDPNLAIARDLHTRKIKMKEVRDRIESGELAQETAGTGGNQNAVRQKLRPLIDPKSGQRIKNLTKDEKAAIRRVTKGGRGQNALRLLTAFDPTAGKLQAMMSGPMAWGTGGLSLPLMPVGMAAKAGEAAIASRNVQKLLDLISTGGTRPKAPPMSSLAGPAIGPTQLPKLSPRGLLGAGVVAAPLARLPSRPVEQRTAPRGKQTQRR